MSGYETHCSGCSRPYRDFAPEGIETCDCHKKPAQSVRDELERPTRCREAIAAFDRRMAEIGGCGNGFCLVTGKAKGMHTNGGCRCWSNKYTAQRVMGAARTLRNALEGALDAE